MDTWGVVLRPHGSPFPPSREAETFKGVRGTRMHYLIKKKFYILGLLESSSQKVYIAK